LDSSWRRKIVYIIVPGWPPGDIADELLACVALVAEERCCPIAIAMNSRKARQMRTTLDFMSTSKAAGRGQIPK